MYLLDLVQMAKSRRKALKRVCIAYPELDFEVCKQLIADAYMSDEESGPEDDDDDPNGEGKRLKWLKLIDAPKGKNGEPLPMYLSKRSEKGTATILELQSVPWRSPEVSASSFSYGISVTH